ncbi:hypothetical protein J4457_07655 [Candidatus Woesearchaeota archaeon]|nr:hypothetical protein [Candidatus Woesearchaeota archaeon]
MIPKVLSLDDEESDVLTLHRLLRGEGFTVDHASSVEDALSFLIDQQNQYGAIITDFNLSGVNDITGNQFLRLVKGLAWSEDPEISKVVDTAFEHDQTNYDRFLKRYEGIVLVLFSGNNFSSDKDPCLNDVFVEQKNPYDSNCSAEKRILSYLRDCLFPGNG